MNRAAIEKKLHEIADNTEIGNGVPVSLQAIDNRLYMRGELRQNGSDSHFQWYVSQVIGNAFCNFHTSDVTDISWSEMSMRYIITIVIKE